jgi:hypothetical protein
MGARIDDLEKNIGELMTQAGVDEPEKWLGYKVRWTFFIVYTTNFFLW